jgi:hypothetical protein
MAEFLACPRCGNRVDEVDGQETVIPGVAKRVEVPGEWATHMVFLYCPHCGAVLGVVPEP